LSLRNTTFKKAAKRIRESEFVIPVFFVFLVLWIMSLAFAVEDYWTSFWGYGLLPTQSGFWWTAYVVAALPSVGQIAAGYIAIALGWDEKSDRKYTLVSIGIWLMLFTIDAFTDMFFRMDVPDPGWRTALTAVFQTVGIFTIGSELAFVVGFGMAFQLLPDAIAQTMSIGVRLRSRMQQIKLAWAEASNHEMYR
jgi:hypothetical protein